MAKQVCEKQNQRTCEFHALKEKKLSIGTYFMI